MAAKTNPGSFRPWKPPPSAPFSLAFPQNRKLGAPIALRLWHGAGGRNRQWPLRADTPSAGAGYKREPGLPISIFIGVEGA